MARGDMMDLIKMSHGRARHIRANGYVPPPMQNLKARVRNNNQQFENALGAWTDSVDSYLKTKKKAASKLSELRKSIDEGREEGEAHDSEVSDALSQIEF